MTTRPSVHEYLASIGRRGGQAKSEAKTIAARENARKSWLNRQARRAAILAREERLATAIATGGTVLAILIAFV